MDDQTWDGLWWLPDTPESKVAGTLTIEDGRMRLALIGALDSHLTAGEAVTKDGTTTVSFTERSMERMEKAGVYPRVLGQAGNDAYTLEDCFQTRRRSQMFGGLQLQQLVVGQVFKGVHFEAGEALEFSKVYAWMNGLAHWVMESGLEESVEFTKSDDGLEQHTATNLKIKPLPLKTCAGPSGATVSLGQTYGVSGDSVVERRLTQDFYFSVAFGTKQPLATVLEQLSDLQDLVTAGTDRTAAYSKVSVRHPDVVHKVGDKTYDVPIEMFATWQVERGEERRTLTHHEMFFTLPDIGGFDGIERWLTITAKHRSALGRVMSTRYSSAMMVSDRVLNCAAALEAYDRDTHLDDVSFATRIQRSVDHAEEVFEKLVGHGPTWVNALKDARNDVAHHKASMGTVSSEHYFLAESAYWLFVLCVLRDAAAPVTAFDHIAEHKKYRWLQRRLDEVLSSTPPATS